MYCYFFLSFHLLLILVPTVSYYPALAALFPLRLTNSGLSRSPGQDGQHEDPVNCIPLHYILSQMILPGQPEGQEDFELCCYAHQ